ncbi:MAG TPA: RNA methyltransferase [Candidatus Sulfomarinibacteraceae bacterium]|nr:RNA methyltransferase [Candidatus Sulfomarinibacteraceae bacterium]
MITSTSNSKVKYVRRLQSDRRFREREAAFVVEGTRWLDEVVQSGRSPQLVFYTAAWAEDPQRAQLLAQIEGAAQAVGEEVMAAMSDVATPPGLLVVLPMAPRPLPENPDLLLILDAVRTPGNMGTMLRTAAAAGVDAVLLAPGCVDLYNPKVIRGGMGAHLRLPVHSAAWPEIKALTKGMAVWLAAADGAYPYTDVNWRRPSALIIGSEASGAGKHASGIATQTVYIPMHAATESLNAAIAAGVILFEAARQRR